MIFSSKNMEKCVYFGEVETKKQIEKIKQLIEC
jgi:hypothetical protein